MSNIIEIKNITKEFKVLNRREGLQNRPCCGQYQHEH